jgi:redox-sensitive bicupin YhaK (pirin superfamily)
MENMVLHKADSRGMANHGWLKTAHTFSFANYYNPDRIHFGALRVLNDDIVAGGMGFGMHPHDNMEIITIPLEGELRHKDSMGNTSVIKKGDVQVMSAGTGIMHSEMNHLPDQLVKLLQIWIIPNKRNVLPRYDEITISEKFQLNQFQQIVSPNPDDEGAYIHQNAWFNLGTFEEGKSADYQTHLPGNGAYFFIIEGKASVHQQILERRDGAGFWNRDNFEIQFQETTQMLIMEVPMNF